MGRSKGGNYGVLRIYLGSISHGGRNRDFGDGA